MRVNERPLRTYWSLVTVGMAALTFFGLTRRAGFGAVTATVCVVALRNAAVILDHAVTIGMSAILLGHTNTLFPFMSARIAIPSGQKVS